MPKRAAALLKGTEVQLDAVKAFNEAVSECRKPLPLSLSLDLLPEIIGRGGANIREMERNTGAKVDIDKTWKAK